MISLQSTNELYIKSASVFTQSEMFFKSASVFTSLWPDDAPPEPGPEDEYFRMTIDTTKTAPTNNYTIYGLNNGTYDCVVDWGDSNTSTITAWNDGDLNHTYAAGGVYQISITGSFGSPNFGYSTAAGSSIKLKAISVDVWGKVNWTSFDQAFYGCNNLHFPSTQSIVLPSDVNLCFGDIQANTSSYDALDTSGVTKMRALFYYHINNTSSIDHLDSSAVTDMEYVFCENRSRKFSLSHFDISSVATNKMVNLCSDGATAVDINETGTSTNYDDTLISWAAQTSNAQNPNFGGSKYGTTGATARSTLVGAGWSIVDGGAI